MKKLAYVLFLALLVSCAGVNAAGTPKEYTCPAPLTIPVEKAVVVTPAPVVVAPAPVAVAPAPAKAEIYPFYFDFDKSDPSKNVRAASAAVKALNADKSKKAELQGNCDFKGSVAHNMKLGDRRAKEVKALLVRNGVDEKRLSTVSFGKSKATGKTDETRKLDRRVDIVVK